MTERPILAVVCGVLRPYRVHFHRRLARELPEFQLRTLVTHEFNIVPTPEVFDPAIGPVLFGKGESVRTQGKLRSLAPAWKKGGRIARWLGDHNVAAVICVGYNDASFARIIAWCRRRGLPCFLWGDSNIRNDRATGWKALVKGRYLGRLLRQCSGVMACGRLGKAYFVKYGADSGRVFFAPYEPDYAAIAAVGQDAVDAARREYGFDAGRRRLIYAGRLVRRKRVDLLLQAFVRIADQRPEWDLIVVGQGEEKERLQAMAPPALQERVRWAPFIVDPSQLFGVYRNCDVFVLPSEYEAWALVVNEAMAAGLAVVASDVVGAAHELIEDGVNGRIFRSGDVEHLIEALLDATAHGRADFMRQGVPHALTRWRQIADPVDGVRRALHSVGLLSAGAGAPLPDDSPPAAALPDRQASAAPLDPAAAVKATTAP